MYGFTNQRISFTYFDNVAAGEEWSSSNGHPWKEGLCHTFRLRSHTSDILRGQHFEVSEEQLVMILCLKIDYLHEVTTKEVAHFDCRKWPEWSKHLKK